MTKVNFKNFFEPNGVVIAGALAKDVAVSNGLIVPPLRRPQEPEDVANLVAFLVSEEARNITGQAIHVDGGALMH